MGFKENIISWFITKTIKESKMWKFLEGKKSYLVAGTNLIMGIWLAAAQQHVPGVPEIPGVLIAVLGGLGIWTRAIAKPNA